MPYIDKDLRNEFDECIDTMCRVALENTTSDKRAGLSNYIITRLLLGIIIPANYNDYNSAIGVLECCKLELYRRAIGPYENKAIDKNGDLEEYK